MPFTYTSGYQRLENPDGFGDAALTCFFFLRSLRPTASNSKPAAFHRKAHDLRFDHFLGSLCQSDK